MTAKSRPSASPAPALEATDVGLRGWRLPWSTVGFLLAGALALAALLYQVGAGEVAALLGGLGWSAPAILLPYGLISFVDAVGWSRALPRRSRGRVSVTRLFLFRHAGEAISNLTPSAGLGGEPFKVYLLRRHGVAGADAVASVVIAKTAIVCSQFVLTLIGLLFLASWLGLLRDRAPWLIGASVLALAVSAILVVGQRRGFAARVVRLIDRLGSRWELVRRFERKAVEVDAALASFYRDDPRNFALSATLHMTGWLIGVGEVMFFFLLMGVECSWPQAVIIEALTQATMAAAAFIPSGLGVQEISGAVLCRFLGIGEAAGTALMLLKRAREIAFTALGVSLMSWLARGTRRER